MNPDHVILTAQTEFVTELTFPWLRTDAEYAAITAVRNRRSPDIWTVQDGNRYWQGTASTSEDEVPEGWFVMDHREATTFPLSLAITTAKAIAKNKAADVAKRFGQMDAMITAMRAVLPVEYRERSEGWGENPQDGDVCVTLGTNGRDEAMTGQVRIFTWPHTPGDGIEHTPDWLRHQEAIATAFRVVGWAVKPNSMGIATWYTPRSEKDAG